MSWKRPHLLTSWTSSREGRRESRAGPSILRRSQLLLDQRYSPCSITRPETAKGGEQLDREAGTAQRRAIGVGDPVRLSLSTNLERIDSSACSSASLARISPSPTAGNVSDLHAGTLRMVDQPTAS